MLCLTDCEGLTDWAAGYVGSRRDRRCSSDGSPGAGVVLPHSQITIRPNGITDREK